MLVTYTDIYPERRHPLHPFLEKLRALLSNRNIYRN